MVQYAGRVATGQPIVQYAGRVVHLWNSMSEERPAYDTVCRRVNCLWYSMPEERPAYGTACQPACYSVEYDVLQTTELLYHQGVSSVHGPAWSNNIITIKTQKKKIRGIG